MAWPTDPAQGWRGLSPHSFPYAHTPFAAPAAVSTETPLWALRELGDRFSDVVFTVRNHDAVNRAAMYVEQSESGSVNDEDREILYIAPLRERTFEFRDILRLMFGLTASGDPDAAYPTVNVSFQVLVRLRQPNR